MGLKGTMNNENLSVELSIGQTANNDIPSKQPLQCSLCSSRSTLHTCRSRTLFLQGTYFVAGKVPPWSNIGLGYP